MMLKYDAKIYAKIYDAKRYYSKINDAKSKLRIVNKQSLYSPGQALTVPSV
jgi:hypothetical protein